MKSKERMLLDKLFSVCQIISNDKWEPSEEQNFRFVISKIVRQIECERAGRLDLLELEKEVKK